MSDARTTIVLALLALLLGATGHDAAAAGDPCLRDNVSPPHLACSHGFVATREPSVYHVEPERPIGDYASRWMIAGYDHGGFLTDAFGCRMWGAARGVRMTENICDDDRLVVRVRSVVGPIHVRFEWQRLRPLRSTR